MFKGKVKSVYTILIFMLAFVTAFVCVAFGFKKDNATYAVINYDYNEFSAVDEVTGVILSVEKVYAISTDDEGLSNDSEFKRTLYTNSDATEELSSMFVQGSDEEDNPNKYYYSNIAENGASKYVVRNGDFVMLNNQLNTDNAYYTPAFSSYRVEGQGETQTVLQQNMQEAIMVSFGQYYFTNRDNNEFAIATKDKGAEIQTINVVARRNGEVISLPSPRNYNNNLYEDFVCIIPQSQGNEGYYEFTFTYFYGGYSYTQTFSFYVLFNTSYNSSYQSSTNNTYSTVPSLENAQLGNNNVYEYYIGKYNQNLNYPTLTFDYTKYDLSYTHTANGVVTTYDYDFVTNSTVGNTSGRMIETITSFGQSTTKTYYLDNYNALSNGLNFVTFVFTEMGNYNFEFDYIYAGYNSENMPEMNLTIPNIELVISGFEMKYTLTGKQEAGFRYLTISGGDNIKDPVDVIIPNGYVRGLVPSNSIVGVIYSLDSEPTSKVGTVISSEDPSLNYKIKDEELKAKLNEEEVGDQYVFNYLYDSLNSGTPTLNADVQTILNYIRDNNFYVKTNQGSIWATSNDNFNAQITNDNVALDSFYYYSTQPIVINEIDGVYSITGSRNPYLNTTTFTRAGYYLLFISVDVNGGGVDYNQIFAFQYTTDTININANIVEDRTGSVVVAPIGSGQFTNKYVQVSWQEPGVFERRITANYYSVANQYLTRNELLKTTPKTLSNGQVLGTNLGNNEGASYLIELLSEGESASYHIFTIDRNPIENIGAYAVERVSTSNNAVSYEFMSINGNYVKLSNSITNSLATLFWNDKESGANITATYTFTPFVRNSEITIDEIYSSNSEVWHNTNYSLGTTVGSFDIDKATTLGNEVAYANVLYRQGIYVFTLIDDAGNSAKFMFIIDNTETFFKLTSGTDTTFKTASSQLFSESVTVELGTHKAIELNISENDDDINSIISLLVNNSNNSAFAEIGYYVQADTNINALRTLFKRMQDSYYLTVKNNSLSSRDSENQTDNNTSIANISINNRQTIIDYVVDTSTSTIRTLYLTSESQRYTLTDVTNSNSYIVIEINVDNSRGMTYYSNNVIKESDILTDGGTNEGSGVYRIYTGSDVYNSDGSIKEIGIDGAHATSANYLAFVWNMGTGKYQVNSVTYDYYALNLSEDNYHNGNDWVLEDGIVKNVFYYNYIRSTTLYSNGTAQNEGELTNDGRGFALLNVENSRSLEGLYVIRREYQRTDEDLGRDSLVQTYYVIIDRNNIIDQNNQHIGGYINLGLKEDETNFTEFNTINTQTEYFSYSEGSETIYQNKAYSLYLSSDKLPITLNIPIAKYFGGNGETGSSYYAGRLSFEFYFRDTQNQLGENKGKVVKLFEITDNNFDDLSKYSNGIYSIDLRGYLTNSGKFNQDIERIVRSMNETNWICLPGDYIVVIRDVVENAGSTGSHEKVIGFRIEQSEVEADVYSVPNRETTIEEAQNFATRVSENEYRLVTSEEFVKLDMSEYIKESTMAGLDLNYLVVTQNRNGYTTNYINHRYQNINGTYRLDDSNPTVVENVYDDSSMLLSRVIYLNTYLRDEEGNINLDNITQTLTYEITIRFRLANTNLTNNERFINCYYYYDSQGNLQTYYEAKITVIIDRVAPTSNIEYLMENDALVDYYVEDNGEDMFESSYIETNSNVYFVNRYKTYYGTGDNSKIYAFRVERSTEFNNDDISRLYFRNISDISSISLSLPAITNISRYQEADKIFEIENYENFLSGNSGYYEILEMDEAGNTTQYVIFFDAINDETTTTPNDDLILEFKVTNLDEDGNIKEEDVVISAGNNGESYTIFDIDLSESYDADGEFVDDFYDKYFRISLISNNPYSETFILTNASTNFSNNGLMNDIVNLIQTAGEGNYILRVETRTESYQVYINYYDYNNRISLNIENLVEVVNGNYQINLQGANVLHEGIMYYASRIEITHNGETNVYDCIPTNGNYYYYLNGDVNNGITQVLTGLSGTYQIRMTDAFKEVYTYRFNTTGEDFYSISFGKEGNANHYEFSNVYYAFNQVNVNFDSSIFSVRVLREVNDSGRSESFTFSSTNNSWMYTDVTIAELVEGENGSVLHLYPYFNSATYQGAKISYTVEFVLGDSTVEYRYYVVLDTRIGAVNLTTNNLAQSMTININTDYHTTISEYITSGTSYLSWNRTTNDILAYSYTLYELKSNGEYVSTDLNSQTSFVISTASDSEGIYKFVIEVLSPSGLVLGNKIFTFQVLQNSSELYYVTLPDNSVAEVNSFFKFEEIASYLTTDRLNQLGLKDANDLSRANVDLYVYNTNLNIQIATDKGVSLNSVVIPFGNSDYQFTIHRAHTDTYSLFFATLIVGKNTDFITNVALTKNSNTETLATNSRFSFTYVGVNTDDFSLRVTPNVPSNLINNPIVARNSLVLDLYLNDEFVNTINLNNNNLAGTVRLLGNGRYTIVFKDLAGNIHTFTTSLGSQQASLDITVLKEPVTTVNDVSPIDNAYYNGGVVVSVYNPATYDIGSINLTATRNGEAYTPIKSQYSYTFLEYGTYRVVVTADFTDANTVTHNLRKVIVFTIINPNEARESIDLTSLSGFKIVSVLHGDRDITNIFNEMFNQNTSGRLLTYNMLLDYQDELNISSGKQVFTITYRVEDEIYPAREVSFTFTMNNEIPNIYCSLAPNETTTSGFTISFNPGIIYEQVGEALIYVNDSLIYSINETSPLTVLSLEITEEQYGAGDYYVRLQTASGQVISSFKAVIKEPLNAWAIVIIVVVSVIVVAIIVTIILLRRKMRIR